MLGTALHQTTDPHFHETALRTALSQTTEPHLHEAAAALHQTSDPLFHESAILPSSHPATQPARHLPLVPTPPMQLQVDGPDFHSPLRHLPLVPQPLEMMVQRHQNDPIRLAARAGLSIRWQMYWKHCNQTRPEMQRHGHNHPTTLRRRRPMREGLGKPQRQVRKPQRQLRYSMKSRMTSWKLFGENPRQPRNPRRYEKAAATRTGEDAAPTEVPTTPPTPQLEPEELDEIVWPEPWEDA